jgi:DNA-binding winged helix-turn-helix (wHTH) protein/TolB-like protein
MPAASNSSYRFGEFRLYPEEKVLFRGDQVADVTPKAVDVLSVLVENAGEIVSKEEIIRRVWPDSFVEEANLSHHIFKLRKALGESTERKMIETVPKRGYRFAADVQTAAPPDPVEPSKRSGYLLLAGAGILILLLVGTGWILQTRKQASPPGIASPDEIRTIAVMPFVNESGNETVEYLSDGMTETLINSLSEVPGLSVKSRSAVFPYKTRDASASTLGSELGVQALLFGRLRVQGDDLTLHLSLVDPHTDNQIWVISTGESFRSSLSFRTRSAVTLREGCTRACPRQRRTN